MQYGERSGTWDVVVLVDVGSDRNAHCDVALGEIKALHYKVNGTDLRAFKSIA